MFAFFVLGREPKLSIAEIRSVYGSSIKSEPVITDELFIAEMESFDAQKAADRLGGSVKYGVAESFENCDEPKMQQLVANRVIAEHAKHERDGKIIFSVSGYHNINSKPFGFSVKSLLEREGYNARLATSNEETMSAAAVTKAKLLEKGCDIVVTHQARKAWIGTTQAVQPFEAQSHRDYDRPHRDQFRGMIPVQLARILVNLALPETTGKVLLDPFCGEGTVLMEAILLGAKAIGADLDPKAVDETRANLEWMKLSAELHVRDARETPNSPRIDAVVTEPFLGAPVTTPLTQAEISKRHKELGALYAASIRPIANALKKDAILVMTLPAYKFISKFLPFPKEGLLPVSMEPIGENIIYKRADQFVGREILIARKK